MAIRVDIAGSRLGIVDFPAEREVPGSSPQYVFMRGVVIPFIPAIGATLYPDTGWAGMEVTGHEVVVGMSTGCIIVDANTWALEELYRVGFRWHRADEWYDSIDNEEDTDGDD